MGCFNLKGYLSKATIAYGDDIVLMIGLCHKKYSMHKYYPMESLVPITLPIYGKYNDYGGIEDVVEDDNVRWLREHVGDIGHIVEAVDETSESAVGKCIESSNQYHPEYKVRYVYDKLMELAPYYIDKDTRLCLLVEHRSVYEEFVVDPLKCAWDPDHVNLDKYFDSIQEKLNELAELEAKGADDLLKYEVRLDLKWNKMDTYFGVGGGYSGILCLYGDNNGFLLDNREEVKKLQQHLWYLVHNGFELDVPMQYSQEDYYNSDIEYHEKCIDLINRLKAKRPWVDDPEDEDYEDDDGDIEIMSDCLIEEKQEVV